MNADLEVTSDGRWVIGKRSAPHCQHCGADPVATVAANGRAEIWQPPFDCCKRARERNDRLRMGDGDAVERQATQERVSY